MGKICSEDGDGGFSGYTQHSCAKDTKNSASAYFHITQHYHNWMILINGFELVANSIGDSSGKDPGIGPQSLREGQR